MGWIKTRVIKKEAVFTVRVGEVFNLESKTGVSRWNSPKFIHSIQKYITNGKGMDFTVEITERGYPMFVVSDNGHTDETTIIDVYVSEGDEETLPLSTATGGFKLASTVLHKSYHLLDRNNNEIAIPNKAKWYKIFYSPIEVEYPSNMCGYLITEDKNSLRVKVGYEKTLANKQTYKLTGETTTTSFDIPSSFFANISIFGSFANRTINVTHRGIAYQLKAFEIHYSGMGTLEPFTVYGASSGASILLTNKISGDSEFHRATVFVEYYSDKSTYVKNSDLPKMQAMLVWGY